MDAFDGTSERERLPDLSTTSLGCSEAKNRAQPFAASEKTVAHRPVQGRGFPIRLRQVTIERAFDQVLARDEIGFDIHNPDCSMLALVIARG